jgi:hypothetical protein
MFFPMAIARKGSRRIALLVAAGTVLLGLVAAVLLPGAVARAETCAKDEVEIGIVHATGCFQEETPKGQSPVYTTTGKFRMNGFDVEPVGGTKVTFAPDDGKRGASVSTNNGFVNLTATHPQFGAIHFNNVLLSFVPPKSGEVTVSQSALAQPFMAIFGLSPLAVKQPITLTEDGAEFELNFSLGSILVNLITHSEKQLSFGVGFTVKDGTYKITSGKWSVASFELAKLLNIDEAEVEFGADKISVDMDASLPAVSGVGLIGGAEFADSKLNRVTAGLSGLNKPLGTSGVYLQKLALSLFLQQPYGASGTIGLTAGPATKFGGRTVTAVAVDGTVEVRGANDAAHKPGYFTARGDVSVVTIPVSNAHFTYNFGQGTDFGVTLGVGFPSATNDPGQPTYIGGAFNGWTSAHHFDVEGSAKLKLLGIDLAGAQVVVSDYGAAGCLQLIAWIGGGVRWSDLRPELLGGWTCDVGAYRPQPGATRLASGGRTRVPLQKDERIVRVWAPDGQDAPDLRFASDQGGELRTPGEDDEDGIARADAGAAIQSDEAGMSTFILDDDVPTAGWSLGQLEGSSDIDRIETAGLLPDHNVRARVTGSGRTRTLRWHARDIRYQQLQFSERMPDGSEVLIHQTRKPSGKLRFRPVEGRGTWGVKRKLAVDVNQRYNTPRDSLVADTYRVRRMPAPSRVRGLRTERRLDDVVVGWNRAERARSYLVTAKALPVGAVYSKRVSGKRKRVRLHVAASERMRVSVTPVNAQDRRGPRTSRSFDTERIVKSRGAAARKLVRGARLTPRGRLLANPVCPPDGSCIVRLAATRGGRVIAAERMRLPADMSDRIAVKLPKRAARKGVTARGVISQVEGTARASRRLPAAARR